MGKFHIKNITIDDIIKSKTGNSPKLGNPRIINMQIRAFMEMIEAMEITFKSAKKALLNITKNDIIK